MKAISTMGRTFTLTQEPSEYGYIVYSCNELPGTVSQGLTKAEALSNIQEAIELSLECESKVSARDVGWEETRLVNGFRWVRGRAALEYSDDGVNQYVWTDGDGATPLKVLVAFCARAKEWKRC